MYFGERVKLRLPDLADAETLTRYFNNFEVRKFLNLMTPVSVEQEEDWIRDVQIRMQKGTGYTFIIENEDGELLGSTGLGSISSINRSARVGIGITNTGYWGKGYGTDAMRLICAIGFQVLNLNRIELDVHAFNQRAIKSYEKVGFVKIGQRRQSNWVDGTYTDSVIMDILREEFVQKYGKIDLGKFEEYSL